MAGVVVSCPACGASLDAGINRAFIFCKFCGQKILFESEQMNINMNVGNSSISAHTSQESMLSAIEYHISLCEYQKAKELITSAILSGVNDYRIYIMSAKVNLITDSNAALFNDLDKLMRIEQTAPNRNEVTLAIRELMSFRGKNGVIALHIATFHERLDYTKYCVEHGSDVNCIAGMNRVSPISIMFVPVSPNSSRIDGTPFIRNKAAVREIRNYLMENGAVDIRRRGY